MYLHVRPGSRFRRDGGDGLQPGGDPGVAGQDEIRRDYCHLPSAV